MTIQRDRRRRKHAAAGVAVALTLYSAPSAVAQPKPPPAIDHARQYTACLALAGRDAKAAQESAKSWAAQGGGLAARHCDAVASIGLGQYDEGAQALERLAAEIPGDDPGLRSGLLGQAGHAWLMAGDTDRAIAAQSAALGLAPGNAEVLIDRAIARAGVGQYWEAIDDLNAVIDKAPGRADVLVMRAAAYRHLGSLELADDDAGRVLEADPGHGDALLERGNIRRAAGDLAGARADWEAVARRAPNAMQGRIARDNLARLAQFMKAMRGKGKAEGPAVTVRPPRPAAAP